MRQIGTVSTAREAVQFTAYLATQGISARQDEGTAGWEIWVRDEDRLPEARAAFAEFQSAPNLAKFQGVESAAAQLQQAEAAQRENMKRNIVPMGRRWQGPSGGRRRPATLAVTLLCVFIGLVTNMGADSDGQLLRNLLFIDQQSQPEDRDLQGIGDKLREIRAGQVWRAFTPALVHFGAPHLALNLLMFYQLGAVIEQRRGSGQLVLLVLATALGGNLAQALLPPSLGGSVHFGGLSGVVFGLLGYLWMKSRFQPSLGLYIQRSSIIFAMVYLALGFAKVFDSESSGIANWAHAGGFLTGIVIGFVPVWWKQG